MPVLTAIDILGVQSYIFASNRLRDVIGASYLVEWATSQTGALSFDALNVPNPKIISAAGGNAILRFETIDSAHQFVMYYSRRLIEKAPGLEVAFAHQLYENGKLARGLLSLQIELAKSKLRRRPHAPQLGISVIQPCAITGLPASDRDRQSNNEWVSSRIAKIREANTVKKTFNRWEPFLPSDLFGHKACFPVVFDDMGRTYGDTSLIGVIHIDGNGIGKRIQRWLIKKLDNTSMSDETLIAEYFEWSEALKKLGEKVFQSIVSRLVDSIERRSSSGGFFVCGEPSPPRHLDFELRIDHGEILLPLRPIILGGDDLTFICDGRIALDLTTTALRAFTHESAYIPELKLLGNDPMTACAGVALVNSHAPFDRSYHLSEGLCRNAKQAKLDAGQDDRCWIDWNIGMNRPDDSVIDIRERQYKKNELTCRPYPLDGDTSTFLTWEWLDRELLGESSKDGRNRHSFRNPETWGQRRNKVKDLGSLVGAGGEAVRIQLEGWISVDPDVKLPNPIDVNGFKGNRTPLLDAIELLDIHLRLNTSEQSKRIDSSSTEDGS